jgi:hypothetical protein
VADSCFSLCTPFSSTNKSDPHDIHVTSMCSLWIVYYKHKFIIAINFFDH